MTPFTIYKTPQGWWDVPVDGSREVAAEIADGYELNRGAYDRRLLVFKVDKSALGITVDAAIERGIIKLVETK